MKQALVLGQSPTGLAAARELASGGYEVWGYDSRSHSVGLSSRYVRRLLAQSDARLLEEIKRLQRPFVVPTTDHYVEWMIEHYAELAVHACVSQSFGDGSAALLLDKEALSQPCLESGVLTPRTWSVADRGSLAAALDQGLRFPIACKPKLRHRWYEILGRRKLLLVESVQELEAELDRLNAWGEFVLQEVIPGPESNIAICGVLCGEGGSVLGSFTGIKVRQWPVGFGSASLARSENLEKPLELSARILGHIGYQGVCGTEFKFDPRDQCYKLIEINPRPTLWFELTRRSGIELVNGAAAVAGGALPIMGRQKYGVEWRYWPPDLLSLLVRHLPSQTRTLLQGERIHSTTPTRSRVGPVLSLTDPRPALTFGASLASAAARRVGDRLRIAAGSRLPGGRTRPTSAVPPSSP